MYLRAEERVRTMAERENPDDRRIAAGPAPAGETGAFREFALHERNGQAATPQAAALRKALRQSYALPSDTFITETIPVLLARLSLRR